MLIVLFVDDARMAAPNKESTNDPVKDLQDKGFNLEMEGDFAECPGVRTDTPEMTEPSA